MASPTFAIFEVVAIADSDDSRALELAGCEGVVLGVSEDDTSGDEWFAVQVSGLPTVMLRGKDLASTGRSVHREEVYGGSHTTVTRGGEWRSDDAATEEDDES